MKRLFPDDEEVGLKKRLLLLWVHCLLFNCDVTHLMHAGMQMAIYPSDEEEKLRQKQQQEEEDADAALVVQFQAPHKH